MLRGGLVWGIVKDYVKLNWSYNEETDTSFLGGPIIPPSLFGGLPLLMMLELSISLSCKPFEICDNFSVLLTRQLYVSSIRASQASSITCP